MKTLMKRAAFVVALAVAAVGLSVAPHLVSRAEASPVSQLAAAAGNASIAARPPSEFPLLLQLNGEPQAGSSTATATGADNTLSVTGGAVYELNCTTDSVFLPGTTVTTTTGSSIYAGAPKYVVVGTNTTSLAFRARTSAGTCVANKLQ